MCPFVRFRAPCGFPPDACCGGGDDPAAVAADADAAAVADDDGAVAAVAAVADGSDTSDVDDGEGVRENREGAGTISKVPGGRPLTIDDIFLLTLPVSVASAAHFVCDRFIVTFLIPPAAPMESLRCIRVCLSPLLSSSS